MCPRVLLTPLQTSSFWRDRDNSRRLPKGHSFSFSPQEHKLYLLYWNGCFTKLDPVARPLTMPTCSLCRARLHTIFGRSDSEQTQSIICAVEERNFWCYPTKPIVSHASCIVCGIPTFMSWSGFGLSCHVLSAHNNVVWCHILVVSSRRNAILRLGMSFLIKLHHGRCSQGAAISPDDVMWWRSAIKQVPLARDSLGPIRLWNRATST